MTVGVYGIFCSATGICLYIGQSKSIEERWRHHRKRLRLRTHRKEFIEWYQENSNNPDSIFMLILQETENTDEAKNTAEIFWFKKLSPKFFGKVPSVNDTWEHSKETKRKISESVIKTLDIRVAPSSDRVFHLNRNRRKTQILHHYKCELCNIPFSLKVKKESRKYCSEKCQRDSLTKTLNLNYEEVYNLYHVQNLSLRKIGDMLGISRTALSLYMEKNNIPRRDKNDNLYKERQRSNN